MATKSPTNVTIYGRLSYPTFSYAEAVQRNAKSQFAKADPADVTPEFNLLLEQPQLDKFITHVKDVFLPFCIEQEKKGEKRNALSAADVKRILAILDSGDWEAQPPYLPIKVVPEKTQPLAPEAVAMVKVKGNKGVDIDQRAIVNHETELVVPDPDVLAYPIVRPIGQTVHQMYPGSYVAATLNLYAFISGKLPGFSAGASVAVFKADGDRFGGGMDVDEDDIFMDA